MKTLLKIIAVLIAIPILLFVVAGIILATLDLNDYRDDISAAVTEATGRQMTVTGELNKSFFPWLGVKIGAISLSNAKGFPDTAFASVEKVEIKIDTMSLLTLKPVVDKILLAGLQVALARNAEGIGNWEDLAGQPTREAEPADKATPPASPPDSSATPDTSINEALAGLSIQGIEIQNALLSWDDQQAKAHYELKNLNISVSEIELHKPIKLQVAFDVSSSAPPLQSHVELSSERIEWDLEKQRYQLLPITLSVQAEGESLPGRTLSVQLSTDITADLAQQQLSAKRLSINTLGLDLTGQMQSSQFLETPQFEANFALAAFNPKELLTKLDITLPPMADEKVMSSLAMNVALQGDTNKLNVEALNITLDDTAIKAQAAISQFDRPAVQFKLDVDSINVDRYLPPPAEEAPAPESAPSEPATSGEPAPEEPLPIPAEMLRTLNIDGQLRIQQLIAQKLQSDNITIHLKAKDGIINIDPLSLQVSGGSINSKVQLDVQEDSPKFALKQQIATVNAGPLLKAVAGDDYVSGKLNLNADVVTAGSFVRDLKKNLNGNAQFQFADGAVKGLNLGEILRKLKAKLKREKYTPSGAPVQTDFTELTGSATITNGIVVNKDLASKSPLLRVKGEGKVELPNDKMNYLVTAYIVGTSKGQAGKELDELKGLAIPVRIKGPFDNLDIKPDYDPIWKSYKNKYKQKLDSKKQQLKSSAKEKKQELKQQLDEKKDSKATEEKQRLKEKTDELKDKLREKFKF